MSRVHIAPDPQSGELRCADLHFTRRRQRTTAHVLPLPDVGQNGGFEAIDDWQLYTVWARWSAASVRMRSLLQQLVQDRDVQAAVIDLDVDQNPEEVRKLGVTLIPSLILVRDGSEASRLMGEVGAKDVKSWLLTAMETA